MIGRPDDDPLVGDPIFGFGMLHILKHDRVECQDDVL